MVLLSLEDLKIFKDVVDCGRNVHHKCIGKEDGRELIPDMKCALKVWIALSSLLNWCVYGGTK